MIVFPWQKGYSSRMPRFLDNTIVNIATVLRVGDFGGEQSGVEV